ncbi:MAG: YihY/virulence factor BrkB family protein [Phycisphaerales bacterium]|nr:YihY/virulence factor BrkB family protein [Phycisphaerales bacterium]
MTPRRISEWIYVGKFCVAHLAEARAAQMAAALSFRMLFGILPVLVVGTLVVKSVMGEEFPAFVTRMIEAAGMDQVSLVRPDVDDGGTTTVPLGTWVNEMVGYAASLNLAAIGWIGVGTVAFSAIWLLVAIEESFNIVCRAPRGRSWLRRVLVYWFLLTFGPLALGAIPWALHKANMWLSDRGFPEGLLGGSSILLGFLVLWATVFVAYLIVPHTRMRLRPTLLGSLMAALLLEIGRRSLGAYMANAFSVSRLYGSLGLIPLFMFWVYLMWLVVLFGLQISALLQALDARGKVRAVAALGRTSLEPALAAAVMEQVVQGFASGRHATLESLAESCGIDLPAAQRIVDALVAARLAIQPTPEGPILPARDPGAIRADEPLEAGFVLADDGRHSSARGVLRTLREAQRKAAHSITLMGPATHPSRAFPPSGHAQESRTP